MHTARDLIEQVQNLPSLPAVYFRVRSALERPDCFALDVAREISCDPALTARLLRVANSTLYGISGKVESVMDALAILGMEQVHSLLLATSVTMAFSKISPPLMNMRRYWRTSLYCALIARCIAKRGRKVRTDRAFVEGLLADIGHLVMYQHMPFKCEDALQQAMESGQAVHEIERDLFGFDHADVGAELLAQWNLSPEMEAAIRHQHEPEEAGAASAEASILHVSTQFAAAAFRAEPPEIWAELVNPQAWQHTGFCADDVGIVKELADDELDTLAQAILPGFSSCRRGLTIRSGEGERAVHIH
jgi:HD-like signal output (HDOD) protein